MMTHLELIEFIYAHREGLDALYKNRDQRIDKTLEESMLVTKIGTDVELSDSYRQFVDMTLKRIDYGIIFHTYSAELAQLRKFRSRYLEEKRGEYLDDIYKLIKDVFFKLSRRDSEIKLLLIKIENETSLDIDLLIEKAMDILEKITEVNHANSEVRGVFEGESYGLSPKIDELIGSISDEMVLFVENISINLNRLDQFIARTRKLRLQNRKLLHLSAKILDENDEELEQQLSLSHKECYMTLYRSQKNSVRTYPDGLESIKVIQKLRQILDIPKVVKEPRQVKIFAPKVQNLYIVNMERIEEDLAKNAVDDIFLFIYHHAELKLLMDSSSLELSQKEESFKLFLQIVIPQRESVEMTNNYNSQEIRIARWI